MAIVRDGWYVVPWQVIFRDVDAFGPRCHPERERGAWWRGRRFNAAPQGSGFAPPTRPGPSLTLGVTCEKVRKLFGSE